MCKVERKRKVDEVHLVAQGLGATPLQKNLLDAAGAGHPETLRALQFGFGVHRQRATAAETTALLTRPGLLRPPGAHLFPASASSRSKMDLRACAPMLRGKVCDLTSSRRLSPHLGPSLQQGSAQRSRKTDLKERRRRHGLTGPAAGRSR